LQNTKEFGPRGPVLKVTETCNIVAGEFTRAFEFDRAGKSINSWQRVFRVEEVTDGGRKEAEDIPGYDCWSMSGLNGVGFTTRGATAAETTYSRSKPLQTIFRSASGEVLSRVEYICHDRDRIVAATQYPASSSFVPWEPGTPV
jgi:hypothetical protein